MEFTGERLVLGQTDKELEIEHVNRYKSAQQFVTKSVCSMRPAERDMVLNCLHNMLFLQSV